MKRRKDAKADMLVKLYLSFFSLSGIIRLAKPISKDTFSSIIEPWKEPRHVKFLRAQAMYWLLVSEVYSQSSSFSRDVLGWKALPTHRLTEKVWHERMGLKFKGRAPKSVFTSQCFEIPSLKSLFTFVHARGEQFSQGGLWVHDQDRIKEDVLQFYQ